MVCLYSQTCTFELQSRYKTPAGHDCVLMSAGRIEVDIQNHHVQGHGGSRRRMHVLPHIFLSVHISLGLTDAFKGRNIHVLYIECIQEQGG